MTLEFTPLLSQIAIKYAFKAATPEGKMTIYALAVVSMLSWTVIVTKVMWLPAIICLILLLPTYWLGRRSELVSLHRKLEKDMANYKEL